MAIHPAFPTSPYEVLSPEQRWFPADEDLRESAYDKLVPPFVNKIRREVETWRENQYERARVRRAACGGRRPGFIAAEYKRDERKNQRYERTGKGYTAGAL